MFTIEGSDETRQILQYFAELTGSFGKQKRQGKKRPGRTGEISIPPFRDFTNGHYNTGALEGIITVGDYKMICGSAEAF